MNLHLSLVKKYFNHNEEKLPTPCMLLNALFSICL